MTDVRSIHQQPVSDASVGVGTRLWAVRYRTLPNLDEERFVRFGPVHDVPMGVELHSDGGVVRITWVKDGSASRIDLAQGPVEERFPGSTLPSMNVGVWNEWRALLARGLTEIIGLDDMDGVRIGFRLGFDGGGCATAALGEVDAEGQLNQSDDNLVVLFDEDLADAYTASLRRAEVLSSVAG